MKLTGIVAGLMAVTAASSAQAATIFGVDENNNLVTFDSSSPGTFTSSVLIAGIPDSVQAIDFRPVNSVLYALGGDRVVYTINTLTGLATAASSALDIQGTTFGFDFNPTIDRLRIVSNTNQNYVFNPNDGTVASFTNVAYGTGDPNFGDEPDVTANAYTGTGGPVATTVHYALDTQGNVLVTQNNNAGTLTTIGDLGLDVGRRASFDIVGSDAFVYSDRSLYRVNLASGALTTIGTTPSNLFGIAIQSAVPEPSTWAMMLVGFGAVGMAMRRRRRSLRVTYA